jgi:8-oxo-dGTP diphosphatase
MPQITARRVADIDWPSWQPVDHATLLFVIDGPRVLLIRKLRGLGAGKINGPGGRIEPGESALEGAVREVREETGVVALEVSERGQLSFQFVDGYSIHAVVFRAERHEGDPHATDEAIPLWTPIDDLPFSEMWADDRLWLPPCLRGLHFTGRFVFDGDAMLDHEVQSW